MIPPSHLVQLQRSSYDVQTSALNQHPHEKNATSNLTARGTSSLPYPIKDLPSPQQLLEKLEAKWYQGLKDYASERRAKDRLQFLEYQAELYRRSDEWYEKSDKIRKFWSNQVELNLLWLSPHLPFSCVSRKTQEEDWNRLPRGIQAGLNELAKAPEFTQVLHDEVASRGLGLKVVTSCIASVYEKVLQRARGNDFIITLYKEDYTANEGAVLAAFLRMQSERSCGLEWREEANYPLS
ncbi:hypothetical protein B9Z19DRAFT_1134629 [Tuber borchii]|uniref:Uncharacterized protein n=1 Tax=Tuber borchii TaxID=42251 RepID=A0A2T6ZDX9_TUBBO|nr:hypothetical protein B9Z19DRAFT_1134629 [Tuber borchii]